MNKAKLLPPLYPIVHKTCGQTAFYYTEFPTAGKKLVHQKARLMTGEAPQVGRKVTCGSCHSEIAMSGDLRVSLRDN